MGRVVAVISVQVLLYYKETAFLFLLGFTLGKALLTLFEQGRAGLRLKAA